MFKAAAEGPVSAPSPEAYSDLRTARTMDHLLALMGVTALGAGGFRAAIGVGNQLAPRKSIRGWPPSRKAVVEIPFRKKTARRRPIIDAADNMRRLNAQRVTGSPGQQRADVDASIAANLAKLRANRAAPGYAGSYARTNVEPYGTQATGSGPSAYSQPVSLDPHAAVELSTARHQMGANATAANQAATASRVGDSLAARLNAGRNPELRGAPLPGLESPFPARVQPAVGRFNPPRTPPALASRPPTPALAPTPARPPAPAPTSTPTIKPPVAPSFMAKASVAGSFSKRAEDGFQPSGIAQKLTRILGLSREGSKPSVVRDLVNPAHATRIWESPWAMGALPIGALGAGYAGWKAVDKADKAYRDLDSRMEIGDAKKRYEQALKRRVLSKSASDRPTLDDLADRYAKEALDLSGITSLPLGVALALTGAGAFFGARKGYADSTADKSTLEKVVRERQRDIASGPPRPIVIAPKEIAARTGPLGLFRDRDVEKFESED